LLIDLCTGPCQTKGREAKGLFSLIVTRNFNRYMRCSGHAKTSYVLPVGVRRGVADMLVMFPVTP
jgi:hypothetical protein